MWLLASFDYGLGVSDRGELLILKRRRSNCSNDRDDEREEKSAPSAHSSDAFLPCHLMPLLLVTMTRMTCIMTRIFDS